MSSRIPCFQKRKLGKISSGVGNGGLPSGETLYAESTVLFFVRWQSYLTQDAYVEHSRNLSLNVKSTLKEKENYSLTRHGNAFFEGGFVRESVRRCHVGNRNWEIGIITNLRQ